jgi:hypothetical protein
MPDYFLTQSFSERFLSLVPGACGVIEMTLFFMELPCPFPLGRLLFLEKWIWFCLGLNQDWLINSSCGRVVSCNLLFFFNFIIGVGASPTDNRQKLFFLILKPV